MAVLEWINIGCIFFHIYLLHFQEFVLKYLEPAEDVNYCVLHLLMDIFLINLPRGFMKALTSLAPRASCGNEHPSLTTHFINFFV